MKVPARRRDRRITFLERVTTQDEAYGTTIEGVWEDVATVWAEVQDILPSRGETLAQGVNITRRPCRIRILYRDDITSDMRIEYGARNLRIVSQPAEIGRREGLVIMAEELSTEGQEP